MNTYPVTDQEPIVLPARSRLYSLQPIGIGSQLSESLTSYVSRLAEAHRVRLSTVVLHEIVPHFHRRSIATDGGANELLSHFNGSLNGTGRTGARLLQIVESLTGQDLVATTMQRWSSVLASRNLLKEMQAWCPDCLEVWRATNQPVYIPLLWQLKAVNVCPVDGCDLVDICPNCQRRHRPFSWNWKPGLCPKCGVYLGNAGRRGADRLYANNSVRKREMFKTESIVEILEQNPKLQSSPSLATFADNISELTNLLAGGVASNFATLVGVSHDTIDKWRSMKQAPQLPRLISIGYRLGLSPMRLLCNSIRQEGITISLCNDNVAEEVAKPPAKRCPVITKEQLTEIAYSQKAPALSLAVISTRLNCKQSLIKREYPSIAKEITERYKAYLKERSQTRHSKIKEALNAAIASLHRADIYPTRSQVGAILENPNWWMERWVREEYDKVLESFRRSQHAQNP
jgi:hypothetical protein